MWNTRRDIKRKIKQKQKELHLLIRTKGISDPDVYSKSCELDCLIVDYMKNYNNIVSHSLFSNY